ncbi:MAG: PD-(D/E)XK nuclease family protein [Lawsonibacter sp.]
MWQRSWAGWSTRQSASAICSVGCFGRCRRWWTMWRRSWPPPSSAPSPSSWALAAGQDLPPVELTVDGVTISVTGFVDRVDGWVHDGRLYLRVVDYKTGKKSFDLTEVWNGLGLQMLLYLFALEDRGAGLLRTAGRWGRGALSPRPGRGGPREPRP